MIAIGSEVKTIWSVIVIYLKLWFTPFPVHSGGIRTHRTKWKETGPLLVLKLSSSGWLNNPRNASLDLIKRPMLMFYQPEIRIFSNYWLFRTGQTFHADFADCHHCLTKRHLAERPALWLIKPTDASACILSTNYQCLTVKNVREEEKMTVHLTVTIKERFPAGSKSETNISSITVLVQDSILLLLFMFAC